MAFVCFWTFLFFFGFGLIFLVFFGRPKTKVLLQYMHFILEVNFPLFLFKFFWSQTWLEIIHSLRRDYPALIDFSFFRDFHLFVVGKTSETSYHVTCLYLYIKQQNKAHAHMEKILTNFAFRRFFVFVVVSMEGRTEFHMSFQWSFVMELFATTVAFLHFVPWNWRVLFTLFHLHIPNTHQW